MRCHHPIDHAAVLHLVESTAVNWDDSFSNVDAVK